MLSRRVSGWECGVNSQEGNLHAAGYHAGCEGAELRGEGIYIRKSSDGNWNFNAKDAVKITH